MFGGSFQTEKEATAHCNLILKTNPSYTLYVTDMGHSRVVSCSKDWVEQEENVPDPDNEPEYPVTDQSSKDIHNVIKEHNDSQPHTSFSSSDEKRKEIDRYLTDWSRLVTPDTEWDITKWQELVREVRNLQSQLNIPEDQNRAMPVPNETKDTRSGKETNAELTDFDYEIFEEHQKELEAELLLKFADAMDTYTFRRQRYANACRLIASSMSHLAMNRVEEYNAEIIRLHNLQPSHKLEWIRRYKNALANSGIVVSDTDPNHIIRHLALPGEPPVCIEDDLRRMKSHRRAQRANNQSVQRM